MPRFSLRRSLSIAAFLVLALLAPFAQHIAHPTTAHASSPPYTVSGNKILDGSGAQFTPYGVQLLQGEFAASNWTTSDQSNITQAVVNEDANNWHANTTRIQVSSANWFDTSASYNGHSGAETCTDANGHQYTNISSALAHRLDDIVGWANADNMNVIITAQYEPNTDQPMPTQDTINYWGAMGCHYEGNQRVFFDLFNEPRTHQVDKCAASVNNASNCDFQWWLNGGVGSDGVTYKGMQAVANEVRQTVGANNLIFAEGISYGGNISYVYCNAADCPNGDGPKTNTLSNSNVVYVVHPYLGNNYTTELEWQQNFGNAAATGNFPVVADEWGESQQLQSCNTADPTLVPSFFSYLDNVVDQHTGNSGRSVGLVAFTFYPGRMNEEWDFTTPTFYSGSTTTCTPGNPFTSMTIEGAGQLTQNYFAGKTTATLAVSPNPDQPYSALNVTGTNFGASESVKVYLDSTTSTPIATPTSDATGEFTTSPVLAKNYGGSHSVIAVGQTSGKQATTPLTISSVEILNPTSGHVGATVSITDSGFGANEVINAYWEPANTLLGSGTTGPLGSLTSPNTINFSVPSTANGTYTVKSVGQTSGDVATATFTVN